MPKEDRPYRKLALFHLIATAIEAAEQKGFYTQKILKYKPNSPNWKATELELSEAAMRLAHSVREINLHRLK